MAFKKALSVFLFLIHPFLHCPSSPSLVCPITPFKDPGVCYSYTYTWGLSHCCLIGLKIPSVGGDSCLVL